MDNDEDLRLIKVQVATCAKCDGTIMLAVQKGIDKKSGREF